MFETNQIFQKIHATSVMLKKLTEFDSVQLAIYVIDSLTKFDNNSKNFALEILIIESKLKLFNVSFTLFSRD